MGFTLEVVVVAKNGLKSIYWRKKTVGWVKIPQEKICKNLFEVFLDTFSTQNLS